MTLCDSRAADIVCMVPIASVTRHCLEFLQDLVTLLTEQWFLVVVLKSFSSYTVFYVPILEVVSLLQPSDLSLTSTSTALLFTLTDLEIF